MKTRLIILALIAAMLSASVLAPMSGAAASRSQASGTTSTPSVAGPAQSLTAIPITGTNKQGTFTGFLNIQNFTNQGGKLFAVGLVSGVLTKSHGKAQVLRTVANAPVTVPVSKISSSGSGATSSGSGSGTGAMSPDARSEGRTAIVSCGILNLVLGPLNLNLLGLVVTLNQVTLNISAVPGAGNLLGNLLCGITNLLNGGITLGSLAGLLNGLLQILRPTSVVSPFTNVPVTGKAGQGTFAGLLNIKSFADQGGKLMAIGTMTGAASNGKTVTNAPVTLPVSATTAAPATAPATGAIAPMGQSATGRTARSTAVSCPILYLNLAPTHLDLLGLNVDLSQVILTVTAVSAAGNLLGNLLCAVTHLLDPGSLLGGLISGVTLSQLVTALNNLLNAFQGTLSAPLAAVPVTGKAANGQTFTGLLNIHNFISQNGKTFAVGTLNGVLSAASGVAPHMATGALGKASNTGGLVSNVPVQIPVTASCPILHLDLGPLSLNLLGLQVNLSRVVLNITAQPGPGNLLGNLLCGVAHLLDDLNGVVLPLFA